MALAAEQFQPGNLVRARGREWVVLPETRDQVLKLRSLGGSEEDATFIYELVASFINLSKLLK